ncbi:MAG: T9SS type A sorting domain-containing protein [Bacteroidetes bacterium]|nr:MAG: T9SS type A sorting domain-containing protein [Bacteroidota bacterium]
MVNQLSERKLRFLLFTLLISLGGISFAQFNGFAFKKAMIESPDSPGPFAVSNDGAITLRNLRAHGVHIKAIQKTWIYVTSTPRIMKELKDKGKIRDFSFEFSVPTTLGVQNDSSRHKHFVNQVHQGIGLEMGYTGKGIIIGYVDDGLDFNHPDFKDDDGRTRVMKFWDHSNSNDPDRIPAGFLYGQAYDSSDINNGTFLVQGAPNHGTTVTGAGSGNGRANGTNYGMAPDSKIIAVKSNFSMNNWSLSIADACQFIFEEADKLGLPAVINLSVGSYFGSHDGSDASTRRVEALLDAKPQGRIVVAAAGNGGDYGDYHVKGVVDSDTSFVWLVPNKDSNAWYGPNTAFFDLWGHVNIVENIDYAFGANKANGTYEERGRTSFRNVAGSFATFFQDVILNQSGDTLAVIDVYQGIQDTVYEMFGFFSRIDSTDYNYSFLTKGSGSYDMWTGANTGSEYYFVKDIPDAATFPPIAHYHMPDSMQSLVTGWNCSPKIISVGNFQNRIGYINLDGDPQTFSDEFSRSGELAITSSIGPTRDGRQKPDVSAAGDGSLSPSSLPFLQTQALSFLVDSSGWFGRNGGTSMASPVVSGIAALYLEKCPGMRYDDFIKELQATCYTDEFTGTVPNYGYGYGKVHAHNLMLNNLRPQIDFVVADTVCIEDGLVDLGATPIGGTYTGLGVSGDQFNPVGLKGFTANVKYEVGDKYGCYLESLSESFFVDSCDTNVGGLNQMSLSKKVLVFPNPSDGEFQLIGTNNLSKISLFDTHGRRVAINREGNKFRIVSEESGMYLLKIEEEGHVYYTKIWRL